MTHPPRTDEGSLEFYIDPETPALTEALDHIREKAESIIVHDRAAIVNVRFESQKL